MKNKLTKVNCLMRNSRDTNWYRILKGWITRFFYVVKTTTKCKFYFLTRDFKFVINAKFWNFKAVYFCISCDFFFKYWEYVYLYVCVCYVKYLEKIKKEIATYTFKYIFFNFKILHYIKTLKYLLGNLGLSYYQMNSWYFIFIA